MSDLRLEQAFFEAITAEDAKLRGQLVFIEVIADVPPDTPPAAARRPRTQVISG